MSVRRKRSSSSPEPSVRPQPESSTGDDSKKNKTFSDIDDIKTIPVEEAWTIDTSSLFPEREDRGIRLICVAEKLRLHYDLLLEILPTYIGSCALVRDPAQSILDGEKQPIAVKPAVGPESNLFLKLGVLHPMGGGQAALDSIILIDAHNRRRLVLPFGWGAGRHVMDEAGGQMIIERLKTALVEALGDLLEERHEEFAQAS